MPRLSARRLDPEVGGHPPPEPALADEPLDEEDRRQHHDDQDRRVGNGQAELPRLDPADDVCGGEVVARADQEDHRADRGHRPDEAVHERGHDRGTEERQDDPAHRRARPGAQGERGLVEAPVDLRERGDSRSHADRHVAEDEAEDQDRAGARELDGRHVEREDVGHADDRPRNREGEHRAELEQAPAREPLPREQVCGQHADRGGDGGRDGGDLDRGPEGVPRRSREVEAARRRALDAEARHEVLEGRRVIPPHGPHEPPDDDDGIDHERQDPPRQGERVAAPAERRGERHGKAGVPLPGDRGVGHPTEPPLLRVERPQREGEQHDGEHGRAALIVRRPHHGEEDLDGQELVIARQHQRIAEIGHALHESEQERVRDSGPEERPRHRPERRPAARAERLCRLLERRADPLHDADQDQKRDRREREELGDQHSRQPVDPARPRDPEPVREQGRDSPRPAEEEDQRETNHERRRDDREHGQRAQKRLGGKRRAGGDEGKGQAENRRAGSDEDREKQRVPGHAAPERAGEAVEAPDRPVRELVEKDHRRERATFVAHRAREHRDDRPEDEDHHEADDETDRAGQEGVALHEPPCRQTVAEQNQARQAEKERPQAEARLAGPGGTEEAREPGRRPTSVTDGKSLEGDPGEAARSRHHECGRGAQILLRAAPREKREQERQRGGKEPRPAMEDALEQG